MKYKHIKQQQQQQQKKQQSEETNKRKENQVTSAGRRGGQREIPKTELFFSFFSTSFLVFFLFLCSLLFF